MSTDETIHTYSTPAEIETLLATWYDDEDQVPETAEILLQPLTHEIWRDGSYLRDADGDEFSAKWLTAIAAGERVSIVEISVCDGHMLYAEQAGGSAIKVLRDAIREIRVGGKRWHQIDGLDWAMVLQEDGGVSVGCQRISREGCEAIVRLLAPHVGLQVVDAPTAETPVPVASTASTASARAWKVGDCVIVARKDGQWCEETMNYTLGKEAIVKEVDERDNTVRVEVTGGDWWWYEATSLDPVPA